MAQRDLKRVRSRAQKVQRAEQELRDAIMQAIDSGESYRDIAPYAGLSPSRVFAIVQEARKDAP